MDGTRRSDAETSRGSGSATPTRSNGPMTPPSSSSSSSKPQAAPRSTPRAPLSSKMSLAPDGVFGREAECGVCTKSFNLLRRRHHCRGCNIAVCKECGRKAIDHRKGERSKPQWYCDSCIENDDAIEVTGSRPTLTKRLSFSAPSYAPPMPPVTSVSSGYYCYPCSTMKVTSVVCLHWISCMMVFVGRVLLTVAGEPCKVLRRVRVRAAASREILHRVRDVRASTVAVPRWGCR